MPEYPFLNPDAAKLNIVESDRRSDLQLLGDDISKIFNPNYRRNKLNISGSFNPDVNVSWDGGPKINPNFGGNIQANYKLAKNVNLSGGLNFGSSVGSGPSSQPYWGGLNINLQNKGEVTDSSDFPTYSSWEEGAQANPQSEIWQGKSNPYAKFSQPVMSPIDYAIGATTLVPAKFFSWMTALDFATNPFIGLKTAGKKLSKKWSYKEIMTPTKEKIDFTPMANRLEEMNAALEKSLKNAGSKAEKKAIGEQWAKNNLDEIRKMREATDKIPKSIIDPKILKKLNKIDPQGGSQITKTDLIVTKDPITGEVTKFHGISPTPGKITSSEIEKNLPYNLSKALVPSHLWMTAKNKVPIVKKYGPWKNQTGGDVYQNKGEVEKTKEDTDWTGTTQGEVSSYTDQTLNALMKLKDAGYDSNVIQYLYETFLVESSGGTDPGAGGNTMQIMPEGFEATKDIKSHPNLQKWYDRYSRDFGINWENVTYDQLKSDPMLGMLAARLHMANDPNPVGTTVEERAKQWTLKYNTPDDPRGTSTYYLDKIKEIQKAYPNIKYQLGADILKTGRQTFSDKLQRFGWNVEEKAHQYFGLDEEKENIALRETSAFLNTHFKPKLKEVWEGYSLEEKKQVLGKERWGTEEWGLQTSEDRFERFFKLWLRDNPIFDDINHTIYSYNMAKDLGITKSKILGLGHEGLNLWEGMFGSSSIPQTSGDSGTDMRNNLRGIDAFSKGLSKEELLTSMLTEGTFQEDYEGRVQDRTWKDLIRNWFGKTKKTPIKYQLGSEVTYPNVSGHYVFNTDESRNIGLEGAPIGSSGTFTWDYKDARLLERRQSYPVAVYADGLYQGTLIPGGRLITNPAFRVDEIPLGYQPPESTMQYLASKAPKQKTDMTGRYNTGLSEDDQELYNIFQQSFGVTENDKKDYDVQGLFASGDYKDPAAWESDKFKKPNHPTFSAESIYNEIDDNKGGEYTSDGEFEPSSTNMKYNTVNDLITHLSTSGMRLKLAPYFQKAASIAPDKNKQYSNNADRVGYLRTLRQNAEYGGDVYNKADKELRDLIISNRDIRTGIDSDEQYESKMKSLGVKKYQFEGIVLPPDYPSFSSNDQTYIGPSTETGLSKEAKEQIYDEKFVDYVKSHPSEFLPGTEAYKKLPWDLQGYIMGNVVGTDLLHIPKFMFTLGLPQDEDYDRNTTWGGRATSTLGAANWTMAGEIFGGAMGWGAKKLTPGVTALESKVSSVFKPKQIESVSTKIDDQWVSPDEELYRQFYNQQSNPLQVKALMSGNKLEKMTSKAGNINTNQLKQYIDSKNISQGDRTIMQQVFDNLRLSEQKEVSLNTFKSSVNQRLIPLTATERPGFAHSDYGVDRLGYGKPMVNVHGYETASTSPTTQYVGINKIGTVTYSNPTRFGKGSMKHNFGEGSDFTQGWSRYMINKENPNTAYILEMQSDAAQGSGFEASLLSHAQKGEFGSKLRGFNAKTLEIRKQQIHDAIAQHKKDISSGIAQRKVRGLKIDIKSLESELANIDQKWAFYGNWESRLFQENLTWASEQGLTTMRYPTPQTAAKIQNYQGGSGLTTWPEYSTKITDSQSNLLNTTISKKDFLAQVTGKQEPHYEMVGDVKIVRTFPEYSQLKSKKELYYGLDVHTLDDFLTKKTNADGNIDQKLINQFAEIRVYGRNSNAETGWEHFGKVSDNSLVDAQIVSPKLKASWKVFRDASAPEFNIKNFPSAQQTILNRYKNIPNIAKKSNLNVKTVTGPKGNTWYEFDIPQNVQSGTAEKKAFKQYGGEVRKNNVFGYNYD